MNVARPIKKEEYDLFRKELYEFKDGREVGVTFSVGLDADPSSNPKAIAEKLAHVQGFKDRALMILNRAVLGESFRKSAVKCIEAKYEAETRRAMLNENVAKAKNQEMRGAEASKIAEAIIVKEVYQTRKPAEGEKPIQLTIMVKAPGDAHSQGGWIWLTRNLPDGKEAAFMGNFCFTCHADANEKHPFGDGNPNEEFRDYVFFIPGEEAQGPGPASGY